MGLWEISFRTQYEYPFIRMSGRYPGLPISMWCIWDRELLHVPTQDEETLKSLEKDIRKAGRVVDRWVEAQEARLFLLRCTCDTFDSPWNVWNAHECFDAPPAVYQDGWGYGSMPSILATVTYDRVWFNEVQTPPVPEPATGVLVALGVAGFITARRRR